MREIEFGTHIFYVSEEKYAEVYSGQRRSVWWQTAVLSCFKINRDLRELIRPSKVKCEIYNKFKILTAHGHSTTETGWTHEIKA